jgi:fatty-acyl-CoA synthase
MSSGPSNIEAGAGMSHVRGNNTALLIGTPIGSYLSHVAASYGEREALVVPHQGVRWTYAELEQRANELAAGLIALGLSPGDRIGIWSPNCAEWVLAQFATAKAGLILVTINPAYRTSELVHALRSVACKAIISAKQFKTSNYLEMLGEVLPGLADGGPLSSELHELQHVIVIDDIKHRGCLRFSDIAAKADDAAHIRLAEVGASIQMDDPVNIQFTSGTTGLPKGATLTHKNLINNAFFVGEATGLLAGSRLCIPVPLYHCFGMVMGVLGCLTHKATMVLPGESFDALAVMSAIEAERCDALFGVPTMYITQLNHPEFHKYNLTSLRCGIMAGAPCPIEVMREVVERMHMREITIAYGMTETSPISFQSSLDDPLDLRVSTVGRIQPHVEVKIIDAEGRTTPCGVAGELCTRGYSVMLGYWGDEARTYEAIDASGWMHTGDLATIDAEGYCRIVGRIKDMVIRGGENIYPREIEEFLYGHPDILDVQVFGVPDSRFGEALCAWVIARNGAGLGKEDVEAYCQGKIAHHKVPRHIRIVDTFPTTVTGKVQKFAMRELMITEFAAEA